MPTTARKTTGKSKASKSAKKPTTVSAAAKKKITITKAYTKSEILNYLAENTELKKKEVASVIDALTELMELHLNSKKGPGEFVVPGLLKCRLVQKPATKAKPGINPFTGEKTIFKAKPARNIVKIRPLKKLKDMVA
jgi:nucleoid DNA-binding protein